MNEQKIFKKLKIFNKTKYPNSNYLSRYGFYIPSFVKIKNSEMDYIVAILNKIFI